MRRYRTTSVHIVLLTTALAARTWAGQSETLRAAESGVSPEFCPALRALVDAAPGGFVSIRGKARRGDDHSWQGTKRLPGASECTLFGGPPPAYSCTLYAGDVEETADGMYDRAVSGVKDCLAARNMTEKVDGLHTRTTTAEGGGGPRVRVVSRDVSGDAYLVELWVDATGH